MLEGKGLNLVEKLMVEQWEKYLEVVELKPYFPETKTSFFN